MFLTDKHVLISAIWLRCLACLRLPAKEPGLDGAAISESTANERKCQPTWLRQLPDRILLLRRWPRQSSEQLRELSVPRHSILQQVISLANFIVIFFWVNLFLFNYFLFYFILWFFWVLISVMFVSLLLFYVCAFCCCAHLCGWHRGAFKSTSIFLLMH